MKSKEGVQKQSEEAVFWENMMERETHTNNTLTLCFGTFFVLLSEFKIGTDVNIFNALMQIVEPNYTGIVSGIYYYKFCNRNQKIPCQQSASNIEIFNSTYESNMQQLIDSVDKVMKLLDTDTCKMEKLAKELIELLRDAVDTKTKASQIPDEEKFNINKGNAVDKNDLLCTPALDLRYFLLSVYKFILNNCKDNRVGSATLINWCPKATPNNRRKMLNGPTGESIQQKITITASSGEDDCQNGTPLSALLEDENNIVEFIPFPISKKKSETNDDNKYLFSKLLQNLFPHYASPTIGFAMFTCFFLDGITGFSYYFFDDHFSKDDSEFISLMDKLFNGTSELPFLLRAQIQSALSKENIDDYVDNFLTVNRNKLFERFSLPKEDGLEIFKTALYEMLQLILSGGVEQVDVSGEQDVDEKISAWEQFSNERGHSTASQPNRFHEKNRTARLCGRLDELNYLISFCNSRIPNQPFSWFAISGMAGSGKSRLARELIKWIEFTSSNWKTMKIDVASGESLQDAKDFIKEGCNVLIVLDYYKWYMDSMRNDVQWIYTESNKSDVQVRLILVEREPITENNIGWHPEIFNTIYRQETGTSKPYLDKNGLMFMKPLDDESLLELIHSYADGVGSAEKIDEIQVLKTLSEIDEGFKRPIFVQFITDGMIHGNKTREWDKFATLEHVKEFEISYLTQNCMNLIGLTEPMKRALLTICLRWSVVATLAGSIPWEEIPKLFPDEFERLSKYAIQYEMYDLRRFMSQCLGYVCGEKILPIEPDLVGEYFVITEFEKMDASTRIELIAKAAQVDPDGLFSKSAKIHDDFYDRIKDNEIIESFLWGTLIDARKGKPFLEFGEAIWDRVDKGNDCTDFPALIISRNVLFKDSYYNQDIRGVLWEDSTLRERLNGSFYNELEESLTKNYSDLFIRKTFVGGATDNVFVLSHREVRNFFNLPLETQEPQSNSLMAVDSRPIKESRPCNWWLRSEGYAWTVTGNGRIYNYGDGFSDQSVGVRPVLWIDKVSENEDANHKTLMMELGQNNPIFIETIDGEMEDNISKEQALENIYKRMCQDIRLTISETLKSSDYSIIEDLTKKILVVAMICDGIKLDFDLINMLKSIHNSVNTRSLKTVIKNYITESPYYYKIDESAMCQLIEPEIGAHFVLMYFLENLDAPKEIESVLTTAWWRPYEVSRYLTKFIRYYADIIPRKLQNLLENAVLPDGLTEIQEKAFENCKVLKTIRVPSSVERIEHGAFSRFGSDSVEIILHKGLKRIGEYAFSNCNVRQLVLPEGLTEIAGAAFINCESLLKIEIPNGVKELKDNTFLGCKSLMEVIISESVTRISHLALADCVSLQRIVIADKNSAYISDGSALLTKNGETVVACFREQALPDSVKIIGPNAFCHQDTLKKIVIPQGILEIGNYAFSTCVQLTDVTIPSSVNSINKGAFADCEKLKNVKIPRGVQLIDEDVFARCSTLETIKLPNTIDKIINGAFHHCKSLKEILIPSRVTYIGSGAFSNCTSLKNVVVTNPIQIASSAFYECSALSSFTIKVDKKDIVNNFGSIPRQFEIILNTFQDYPEGEQRVDYREPLKNISFPIEGLFIDDSAFYECKSLSRIVFEVRGE